MARSILCFLNLSTREPIHPPTSQRTNEEKFTTICPKLTLISTIVSSFLNKKTHNELRCDRHYSKKRNRFVSYYILNVTDDFFDIILGPTKITKTEQQEN